MPTFVVETGDGLPDANSLASVGFANGYLENLGAPASWFAATNEVKENALRVATHYVLTVYGGQWRGTVSTAEQALAWPRAGVRDGDTGLTYYPDAIPVKLQQAVVEVARRVIDGVALLPDVASGGGGVSTSSVSLGPISLSETFLGSQSTAPRFPVVDGLLRGLLVNGGNRLLVRVTR